MVIAWLLLCDFFIAGGAVGGYKEQKIPIDEVDLLMNIAESLPGVSSRFGFSRVSFFRNFNTAWCFLVPIQPSCYLRYLRAVILHRNFCCSNLTIEFSVDSSNMRFKYFGTL